MLSFFRFCIHSISILPASCFVALQEYQAFHFALLKIIHMPHNIDRNRNLSEKLGHWYEKKSVHKDIPDILKNNIQSASLLRMF